MWSSSWSRLWFFILPYVISPNPGAVTATDKLKTCVLYFQSDLRLFPPIAYLSFPHECLKCVFTPPICLFTGFVKGTTIYLTVRVKNYYHISLLSCYSHLSSLINFTCKTCIEPTHSSQVTIFSPLDCVIVSQLAQCLHMHTLWSQYTLVSRYQSNEENAFLCFIFSKKRVATNY